MEGLCYYLNGKFGSILPCFAEEIEATTLPWTRLSVDFAAFSTLPSTLLSFMDGTVGLTVEQEDGGLLISTSTKSSLDILY